MHIHVPGHPHPRTCVGSFRTSPDVAAPSQCIAKCSSATPGLRVTFRTGWNTIAHGSTLLLYTSFLREVFPNGFRIYDTLIPLLWQIAPQPNYLRCPKWSLTAALIIYSIQSQILRCYWYRVHCLILITLRSLITAAGDSRLLLLSGRR